MFCGNGMMFYLLLELHASNFKDCKHSFQMPDQKFPSIRISKNHYMSIIQTFCILIHIFQFHLSSWVKCDVMKNHHQLSQKIVNFYRWFKLCCDKYLNWPIMLQYFIELIKHSLIVIFYKLLSSLLLVLNRNGFLPHLRGQFLPLLTFFHFNLIFYYCSLIVDLNPLDLILNLIGLLFKCGMKLTYRLGSWLHYFVLGFGALLFFVRLWFAFFYHC